MNSTKFWKKLGEVSLLYEMEERLGECDGIGIAPVPDLLRNQEGTLNLIFAWSKLSIF